MKSHPYDESIAILIPSWDGYQDVWEPFFHCFFKFWPDCPFPVFLGSNSLKYPNTRITPILYGPDRDYSSNLILMLEHLTQEWVIVWIEDLLLNRHVLTEKVCQILEWGRSRNVGHIRLATSPYSLVSLSTSLSPKEINEIGLIPKGVKYRAGLTVGFWNKNLLLKLLKPGETAWEFESRGTNRSCMLGAEFYSVREYYGKPPLISIVNSIRKSVWTGGGQRLLEQENLNSYTMKRKTEGALSYIYSAKFYDPFRYYFFKIFYSLALRRGLYDS